MWGKKDCLGDAVFFDMPFNPKFAEEITLMFPYFLTHLWVGCRRGNSMENKASFMFHGFGMRCSIYPNAFDVVGMCKAKCFLCGGIKVNQFDFREDFQDIRMFDDTVR